MTCTDPCHPGAGLAARAARPQIKGWLERLPEVAAEDRHRIRAKPPIENLRIHCAEICFARTSPPLFSSVGLDGLGSRDAAVPWMPAYAPPDGHHDPGCAMVGALAAVFRNPPAELRELQYQRVVEEALVLKIGVKSRRPSPNVPMRFAYAPPPATPWPACVSKPPVYAPEYFRPDSADHRACHRAQGQRESVVRIGDGGDVPCSPSQRGRAYRALRESNH